MHLSRPNQKKLITLVHAVGVAKAAHETVWAETIAASRALASKEDGAQERHNKAREQNKGVSKAFMEARDALIEFAETVEILQPGGASADEVEE